MNQSLKEKFGFLLAAIFAFGFGYFSPSLAQTDVSRTKLWAKYVADSIGVSDGTGVVQWSNLQGTAVRNLRQTTSANRPTLKTGILNGHSVVRFNGTTAYMDTSAGGGTNLGEADLYIVVKANADPSTSSTTNGWNYLLSTVVGATTSSHFPHTNNNVYESFRRSLSRVNFDPTPLLTSFRLYSVHADTNQYKIRIDTTTVLNDASAYTLDQTNGAYQIGRSANNTSFFTGDIAEIRIYRPKLSDAQRDSLEDYLGAYYALPYVAQGAVSNTFRSLQVNNTSAIATNASGTLTISGSTGTFSAALPDTIGVGDVITYSSDTKTAFITGRTSSTVYTVKNASGGTPVSASADATWKIYRAYTTLSNAEAGTENTGIAVAIRDFDPNVRDLTANNEIFNLACYRSSNDEAGPITISGSVTDSTRYIRWYAPYSTSEVGTNQRHNGTETQPYFRINSLVSLTSGGTDVVQCLRFEGLIWRMEAINCQNIGITDALANSRIYFSDIVFYGRDGSGCGGTSAGITAGTDFNGKIFARNCIFYKFDGSGNNSGAGRHSAIYYVSSAASAGHIYINNCTDYNSNYFIDHEEPQGFVTVKNSLSQTGDNTTAFFLAGGAAFTAASNYNLSDKAADAPGANSKNSTSVTFVSTAANNYHLDAGDTGAGNSGQDLASDYLPVTTDIDRAARPTGSSTVDIGADEGVLTAAEMNVKGKNVSIVDGDASPSASDSTDFGSVITVSATRKVTFKIFNTGETVLNISGTPKVAVAGTHAADFTVTTQPAATVAAGDSSSFVVEFDPSATGVRSATLSIANDDSDENPYNWSIQGTGITREIDLTGNGSSITNGATTTSAENHTDFGRIAVQNATQSRIFTISNPGTSNLTLSGTPKVVVSGTNSTDFTVTAQPSSPVAGSGSTTFTVVFDPSGSGIRTATLSIANDDVDENPFTFAISGLGSSGRQNSFGQFHFGQHTRF